MPFEPCSWTEMPVLSYVEWDTGHTKLRHRALWQRNRLDSAHDFFEISVRARRHTLQSCLEVAHCQWFCTLRPNGLIVVLHELYPTQGMNLGCSVLVNFSRRTSCVEILTFRSCSLLSFLAAWVDVTFQVKPVLPLISTLLLVFCWYPGETKCVYVDHRQFLQIRASSFTKASVG